MEISDLDFYGLDDILLGAIVDCFCECRQKTRAKCSNKSKCCASHDDGKAAGLPRDQLENVIQSPNLSVL